MLKILLGMEFKTQHIYNFVLEAVVVEIKWYLIKIYVKQVNKYIKYINN